jgi:hypothetical protein
LLDAREHYHVHLSSIDSVVGTAIGRYRIREDDWYATHPPTSPRQGKKSDAPRTFENSVVRPWSWPCVIVMVDRWRPRDDQSLPEIEKQLFLPDGRVIPTCVIYAPPDEEPPPDPDNIGASSSLIGGGYACTRTAQGLTRAGTIGCLVEREGTYYALTNRHVAGPDGGDVDAIIRGQRVPIGISDSQAVSRVPMHELFPAWPGMTAYANIDAGLVRVDDISQWTSQVFGVGEIAEPFEASIETLTLDIIGCPVRAYGGTSGLLEGEIQALFVRYKSVGGYDYISDLLIGRRKRSEDRHANGTRSKVDTRPGDSGTLRSAEQPAGRRQRGAAAGAAARARRARAAARADRDAMGRAERRPRRRQGHARARDVRVDRVPRARRRDRARLQHRSQRVLGQDRSLLDRLEGV